MSATKAQSVSSSPGTSPSAPIEFRSAKTRNEWKAVGEVSDADDAKQLRSFIAGMMTDENLVVMTGLGTSLCVTSEIFGDRLAPTMGDLWQEAEQAWEGDINKLCEQIRYDAPAGKRDFEELMSHCNVALRFTDDAAIRMFVQELEKRVVKRCRFTQDAEDFRHHADFLRRVARRATRRPRMKLFTTNYDLCFEKAAACSRFVTVDGFSHAMPQEFDGAYFGYDIVRRDANEGAPDYIENVFHLYKLHGSLDWENRDGRVVKNPATERPLIIYPRDTKFAASYEQPYLEMMSRFQSALRQPKTALIVVGFGFADKHLSEPILAALRSNVSFKMLIVDPKLRERLEGSYNDAYTQIERFAAAGDPRLGLLNAGFVEFISHIPDLVASTEEERLQKLRATALSPS
jgi:hypothetical protein